MGLKFDRFTWGILIVVLLLLGGAVITANLNRSSADSQPLTYLDEDTPEAVVYNAYVAMQQRDTTKLESLYSQAVLNQENFDLQSRMIYSNNRQQRLRILEIEQMSEDRFLVTYALDNYYQGGGLFDGGSTYTDRRDVSVIREDGRWVLDTALYF